MTKKNPLPKTVPSRSAALSDLHWKEVRGSVYDVVILPWGATEAHNYHLPYGTDNIESDVIAARSAAYALGQRARVVVLPTVPYGVNTGQLDIRLTISINPSTQLSLVHDIVDSLYRQGFRKLVILNSHGGNDFRPIIREITGQFAGMFIGLINWYQLLDQRKYFDEPDDHAGEMETSILLHIAPERVLPLTDAGNGAERRFRLKSLRERWLWTPRAWTKATRDTGVGNPKKATAEKGERFLRDLVSMIGEALVELAAADPRNLYE